MKYKKDNREPDNWKPLADIFSGLMLMFLLILMLIILFVGYKDAFVDPDDDDGGDGDVYEVYIPSDDDGGGGNEEYETIEFAGDEDGLAAVKVVVVDGDTGNVIKEAGIDFNLYTGYRGEQITLYTYYPEKTAYTVFETIKDGTFFLPEKIQENTYVLKNLSAPEGYISGDSMAFTIPSVYYWDDPFVVHFPLYTKKHSFAIRVTDVDTGDPVPYGVYDISTAKGKSVGTIECDANGYGQSAMLPQNVDYVITQSTANEFYSVLERPVYIALNGDAEKVVDIKAVKTAFEVYITDELYKTPIKGATFSLYESNGALIGEYTTGESGMIKLQNLRQDMSYTLEQTGWADKWQKAPYNTKFAVDPKGRINGYSVYSETGTNRMIRIKVSAEYKLLGFDIVGEALTLKDASGSIVHQWNSENGGTLIEGLAIGQYTIEAKNGKSIEITVEDTAEIQQFSYKIFKVWILIIAIIGAFLIIAGIVALIISKTKKKKEKTTEEEESNDESEK